MNSRDKVLRCLRCLKKTVDLTMDLTGCLCPWLASRRSGGEVEMPRWSQPSKAGRSYGVLFRSPQRPLPGTLCSPFKQTAAVSTLRGLTHQWQPPSDHTPTIKYCFIRSVLQRGTPLQKHVLFSLTYSTGDTNQQWHCHLWAMRYDSLVVQMSDYTAQY